MATSQTKRVLELIKRFNDGQKVYIEALHTPEGFGQLADLHSDTLPKLTRTVSRFSFGHF